MATVIVQSDTDPRHRIRVTKIAGMWGGKCPRCRREIATTIQAETLGRDIAVELIEKHIDAGC